MREHEHQLNELTEDPKYKDGESERVIEGKKERDGGNAKT